MTKEELEKVVQGAEYDFLRENPHLGSNIMFLTLGGSHAYGTNVPGSDVDVRGVTGDSKLYLVVPTYSTTLRPKRKTISTSLLGMLRMKKSNGSLLSMPHLPIFRFVTSRVLLRP